MKKIFKAGRGGGHHPDYLLLTVVFILTLGGLVMLASASSDLGKIKFNDSYFYLKHQLINGLIVGLVGFGAAAMVHYQAYKKFAFPFLLLTLAFLALVFTKLGVIAGGASRWLALGPITFQPSELLKLSFVLYLAAWLAGGRASRTKNFNEGLVPFILVSGTTALLLFLQPATSMVVVLIGTGLVMYFLSGARMKYILGLMGIGVAGLALIILATPYRLERVMGFLNPEADSQGANYHLNQALIAIGSGGVGGVGYGESTAKASRLPAVVDDSIFAVIGQEFGFIGGGFVVVLFGTLVFRLFRLASVIKDPFGKLILSGFGTIIAFQSLINIGAISGLLPLTGVPLPFISYGGTALAIFLTMSGIAVNISKYS